MKTDNIHIERLQKKVERNEERLIKLEREQLVIDTKQDEQIKTLFQSVKILRNVTYVFSFLMLLALIYGALGPKGFNAVTNSTKDIHTNMIR